MLQMLHGDKQIVPFILTDLIHLSPISQNRSMIPASGFVYSV